MDINSTSDRTTLALLTTRLVTAAQGHQRRDPSETAGGHLATLIDTAATLAHQIEQGRSVALMEGPTAIVAGQLYALASRRSAYDRTQTTRQHLGAYIDRLTAFAVSAADAIDIAAARER